MYQTEMEGSDNLLKQETMYYKLSDIRPRNLETHQ
jgi:hypothetical protein